MLISDKLIYIELHKTGCTHTQSILCSLPNLDFTIIGKHNAYHTVPKRFLKNFDEKLKIGNIRNPWDWYVSLWAYGCLGKGSIHYRVTKSFSFPSVHFFKMKFKNTYFRVNLVDDPVLWNRLYSDVNNIHNFKQWLKLILKNNEYDIGENYKSSKISSKIGLLTYRYIKLFTKNGGNFLLKTKTFNDVVNHDKEHNFADIIIKNESIHETLLNNFDKLYVSRNELEDILKKFNKKTNASIRKSYQTYYDDECIDLVAQMEKLIIDKYQYEF